MSEPSFTISYSTTSWKGWVKITAASDKQYYYKVFCRYGEVDGTGDIIYESDFIPIRAGGTYTTEHFNLESGTTYTANVLYYTDDDSSTYVDAVGGKDFTTPYELWCIWDFTDPDTGQILDSQSSPTKTSTNWWGYYTGGWFDYEPIKTKKGVEYILRYWEYHNSTFDKEGINRETGEYASWVISAGGASNHTVNAVWQYAYKISAITFDLNGGSGYFPTAGPFYTGRTSSGSNNVYIDYTLPSWQPSPPDSDHSFGGWKLVSTGDIYQPEDTVSLRCTQSGTTYAFEAVWKGQGATPWIYVDNQWKPATVWIYHDGWKPTTVHIYHDGWKPD